MPTTRVGELLELCNSPDHNPIIADLLPGVYEHICMKCGYTEKFKIVRPGVKVTEEHKKPWETPWVQPVYPSPYWLVVPQPPLPVTVPSGPGYWPTIMCEA
jgi:hypothetical protein